MSTAKKENIRVLLVDDDPDALTTVGTLLSERGFRVDTASGGSAALARATEHHPDVVVTDLRMPRMDGLALLRELHAKDRALPVILLTASDDVRPAVAAMRDGAADYLSKPLDVDVLTASMERAFARRDTKQDVENMQQQLRERCGAGLGGLIGASPAMQNVYRTARHVAGTRATVLVSGESGTGKGELARAIHALSPRAGMPFVQLHCASLVDTLLESELFGHEKGAFTGADRRRLGRFEQADGGTLFLDEVGELSALIQVKLLRVLQERTFERVGSNEPIHCDVRILAATNRDLAADTASGRFREDLYYRLNVVRIEMPPLRMRRSDLVMLVHHFIQKFAFENRKQVDGLTERARAKLVAHDWPGNVRSLENMIERAVVLCAGTVLDAEDIPVGAGPEPDGVLRSPGSTIAEIERYAILKTLEACGGSTTRAAEMLQISVRTIQYRLHEYGYVRSRKRTSWVPASSEVTAHPIGQ